MVTFLYSIYLCRIIIFSYYDFVTFKMKLFLFIFRYSKNVYCHNPISYIPFSIILLDHTFTLRVFKLFITINL
jgi:hypothetical protein